MQCVVRCEEHRHQREHAFDFPFSAATRGCGAIAYRAVETNQMETTVWRPPPTGMCQLKATKCTLKNGSPGRCDRPYARHDKRKRGWCIFQLRKLVSGRYRHPPADATCEERGCTAVQARLVAPPLAPTSWASPASWPARWVDPKRPSSSTHTGSAASDAVRGGGGKARYYEAIDGGQLAVLGGGLNKYAISA